MTQPARIYLGIDSMKQLGVPLLPPWMLVHHKVTLPPPPLFLLHFIRFLWQFASTHLYYWVERGTLKLNFFVGGHNTLTWPGLDHRILDSESSAPITGPSFSHECAEEAVLFSTVFLCQLSLGSFNSSNLSLYCLRKVHCQVLLAPKFLWIFATILLLLRASYSIDLPL